MPDNMKTTMPHGTKVLTPTRGINDQITGFKEEVINYNPSPSPLLEQYRPFAQLLEREDSAYPMTLKEALVNKPDAANMLRSDIKFIAFSQMRMMPRTWNLVARLEQSSKPEEEYLRDATFGVIPKKPSGQPVDFVKSAFEGGVKIANDLYRMGVMVLGDDIRFDKIGKIRQTAEALGRAAVMTEEDAFYTSITTAANYTRNSTTGDNDVGANTQTLTFTPTAFDTAMGIISTSRDRKSSSPLGYKADTIISTPRMETFLKQFLLSPDTMRVGGETAANEARGLGTKNPFMGLIRQIVISPWMGATYQWALTDSTVFSYVWQSVEGWTILQDEQTQNAEAWIINDGIRYVIRGYFGNGFVDDRAWFFSDSVTAPAAS